MVVAIGKNRKKGLLNRVCRFHQGQWFIGDDFGGGKRTGLLQRAVVLNKAFKMLSVLDATAGLGEMLLSWLVWVVQSPL